MTENHYLVTNDTYHNINLHDCGVILNGKGDSAKIPIHVFENSKSIQEFRSMISIKKIVLKSVWPNSLITEDHVEPTEKYKLKPPGTNDLLKALLDKMDVLIDKVSSTNVVVGSYQSKPKHHTSEQSSHTGPDVPMFIPSKLIPDNAETRITTKSESTDSADINEVASMLKALRKAQK